MTHYKLHQPHQLGHEENKGEYGKAQHRVGNYFAANVAIEDAHGSAVPF